MNTIGASKCQCRGNDEYFINNKYGKCEPIDYCASMRVDNCAVKCLPKLGSYKCECFEGWTLAKNLSICVPNIETRELCLATQCDHACVRNQHKNSIQCKCFKGYEPNYEISPTKCIDINECLINNGRCSHKCINLIGSFECSCPVGMMLGKDLLTCQSINSFYIINQLLKEFQF
jgi:hypothetical protein